ncbi:MAG: sulfotransferase [Flavobacteriales bacterium]|nr:sulfotransferase [Flavobacteriales bacterium]
MSDYTPCSSPIFLVGSERSGSNLLRSLIGNHSMVEAPTAPHFFDQWSHALWAYGVFAFQPTWGT